MATVAEIARFLEQFAPLPLAESWDNVGLLVGDPSRRVARGLTCLTITTAVVEEAARTETELLVAHHPLPFRPLKRLTSETAEGRLLLELAARRIAVYSPHTAFDSAPQGINQRLAVGLGLQVIAPLVPYTGPPLQGADALESGTHGAGRYGEFPAPRTPAEVAAECRRLLRIEGPLAVVGDRRRPIRRLAVACGSAGEFLAAARHSGCDALLTGETRFHTCLEAEATGIGLILVGHYASERFAVEQLAELLDRQFPDVDFSASRDERDPLHWL